MLTAMRVIALETFTLLRRDKAFMPAVVCGLVVAAFANLASGWSVEDFSKILYDVGYFGFQFTGGAVALLWGTKALSDSKQEGSLEVQLAAPVSRTTWLVAKYLGLALCLLLLGVVLLAFWQGLMLLNGFGWMTALERTGFAFMALGWLVLAALAVLLASVAGQAVALFAGVCLWIAGLVSTEVAATVPLDSPAFIRKGAQIISRVWDLQNFSGHVVEAPGSPLPLMHELTWRAAYGVALILVLLTVAALAFRRRDLTA